MVDLLITQFVSPMSCAANGAGHLLAAAAREARGCCQSGGLAGSTVCHLHSNCSTASLMESAEDAVFGYS